LAFEFFFFELTIRLPERTRCDVGVGQVVFMMVNDDVGE